MVSAPGWVIFSGWTGVGMNFGGRTGTFRPDAVAAHTVFAAFAADAWLAAGLAPLAGCPPELMMLGSTSPTAMTVVTAASRCGPASVAGCRGTSSPPGIRLRGSCPSNAQQSRAQICIEVVIVREFSGNLVSMILGGNK